MLTLHCEQSPRSGSTITLSDKRDELGMLGTRLHWEISDQEIHSLRTYARLAAEVFARNGVARVEVPKGFFEDDALVRAMCGDSYHHMGGSRMSLSPRDGIVDTNLKLHGIANGYLCSSSVFPTSGFSNPTHTLLALAMRLSDHIVSRTNQPAQWPKADLASRAEVPSDIESIPVVEVPGFVEAVPQLGFDCSELKTPKIDRPKPRRLLDAAYAAGVRHFDAAELIRNEEVASLLKDFLRQHPDATVTAKHDFTPYKYAREAKASLDLTLQLLGRDHVELFLLRDPETGDLAEDDLLLLLEDQRRAGKLSNFGIDSSLSRISDLCRDKRAYAPVVQFEYPLSGPSLELPSSYRIHYGRFAQPARALVTVFEQYSGITRQWSEIVNADLREPHMVANLLLKAALNEFPSSLLLFSARSEDRIVNNAEVAKDMKLLAPAQQFLNLVRGKVSGIPSVRHMEPGRTSSVA